MCQAVPAPWSLACRGRARTSYTACVPHAHAQPARRRGPGFPAAQVGAVFQRQVDGALTYGCTMLAIEAQGHDVITVEGLGSPDSMHAVQAAFVEADALMCGFCTPGMVVAVASLLEANPDPTRDQIRKALDGNLCRCGTYPRIFEATELAAARMRGAVLVT